MAKAGREHTRELILQCALDLFSTKGFNGTTASEIANMAGVTELTLYRHFGSKENLFENVILHFLPPLQNGVLNSLNEAYDLEDALRGLSKHYFQVHQTHRKIVQLVILELYQRPEVRKLIAKLHQELRENLQRFFTKRLPQESLEKFNSEVLAYCFHAFLMGHTALLSRITPPDDLHFTENELSDQFTAAFLHGILHPPGLFPLPASSAYGTREQEHSAT